MTREPLSALTTEPTDYRMTDRLHPRPTLRLATHDDLSALLPLFRSYQEHYGQLTAADEAQTRAFLADHLQNPDGGFVVMAWHGDTPIGFATVFLTASGLIAQRLAHLGDLYVAPDHRRAGLGTALFDAVTVETRARGIGLVRWLSLAANAELNSWYEQLTPSAGTFQLYLRPTAPRPPAP